MAANLSRGEVELDLGGTILILRPTYQAQQLIEAELKIRMVPLGEKIYEGDFGMTDVVAIITISAVPNERDWEPDELGDLIAQAGLEATIAPVLEFMSNAIRGWPDQKKGEASPKK